MEKIKESKSYQLLKFISKLGILLSILAVGFVIIIFIAKYLFKFEFNGIMLNNIFFNNIYLNLDVSSEDTYNFEFIIHLATIVLGIISSIMFYCLYAIIKSIEDKKLFSLDTVKSLRVISIIIVIQSYLVVFVDKYIASEVFSRVSLADPILSVKQTISLFPSGLLIALCIFVLAEVFKYACILQKEYDSTV